MHLEFSCLTDNPQTTAEFETTVQTTAEFETTAQTTGEFETTTGSPVEITTESLTTDGYTTAPAYCSFTVEFSGFKNETIVREDKGQLLVYLFIKPSHPSCVFDKQVSFTIKTNDHTATQRDYKGKKFIIFRIFIFLF